MRIFVALCVMVLAAACTPLPQAVRMAPQPDIQLSQVQQDANQYSGKTVRWGGQVVSVDADGSGSTILVAQFKLNSYGRPKVDKESHDYFLVHSDKRIDPKVYDRDTLITVIGKASGDKTIKVNKHDLTVPLVDASQVYRWPYKFYAEDYDSMNYRNFYNRFYALPPFDRPWWY